MKNTRRAIIELLNGLPVSKDTLVGLFLLLLAILTIVIMHSLIPLVPAGR